MQYFPDCDKSKRLGIEEQFIKFRPSPNFKNMKKFLKTKIHTECNVSPLEEAALQTTPTEEKPETKPAVYPPLPLDPPPPDSLLDLNIKLKEEIEDAEYQITPKEEKITDSMENSENLITEFKKDQSEEPQEKPPEKPPVCRDFIRGTCIRPGNCKFVHEFDKSQLVGVYKFCRNFQNSVCSLSNCRYVHATIFEEQNFYRTGILPPRALAHHKKVIQPPPPLEDIQGNLPSNFTVPPPTFQGNTEKPMPIINCIPAANMEVRIEDELPAHDAQTEDVSKSDWAEIGEFSSSPRDIDTETKCENCEIMDFRLQYIKAKYEKSIRSTESINKRISEIDKINQRIYTLILALMKCKSPLKTNGLSLSNTGEDSIKTRLETLNSLISPKSRVPLSSVAIDNKNILNGSSNLSNFMAKLLQCSGEEGAPSDVC